MSKDAEVGLEVLGVLTSAAAAEAQHQVKRRLLLDVVVGQSAAILQLLPREDEALLVRRDTYNKTETSTISSSLINSSMYNKVDFLSICQMRSSSYGRFDKPIQSYLV